MPFMTPDIYHGTYHTIEDQHGDTHYVPDGYQESTILETSTGYLGRWSASGYMDCTDWGPLNATNRASALQAFCDQEDVCATCFEQCWDTDEPCDNLQGA